MSSLPRLLCNAYNSNFKRLAFAWIPAFGHPQETSYRSENFVASEQANQNRENIRLPMKQEIVYKFLRYKCGGDFQRYLYRNDQAWS
jgi:hypothetical protein